MFLEASKLVNSAAIRLIRRCKNNDEDAYNQLISQHEAYLYSICYNYTRNKEEALDMMQEIYIKIFRGLKTFDENQLFLPWLKRLAVNTLINHSKKNRVTETSLDGCWEGKDNPNRTIGPELYLPADSNIEEEVIYKDTRTIIDRLILELPESYRLAITLRYHEDMSYDEISSYLAQPLNTVKSNVYRARKMLRQKMQACELLEV